jgi:ribonuclease BN (tRNA processing enzyme)
VLGSGGPIADDNRASAGYLVWVEGRARLLVDAGGGVFLRFGEAGARIEDLEAVLLTHLHADHSADVPALLKSGYFAERTRPLPIVGPSGGGDFPGVDAFLRALLDPARGAFRYLAGYLDGRKGWFRTPAKVIDATGRSPVKAFTGGGLVAMAVGVEHGQVPALGYVVTVRGKRIGFGGDQSGNNPAFVKLARGADLLVLHHPIPESAEELRRLHATPSELGRAAAGAAARRLVLSHLMARSLRDLARGLELVRRGYRGPVQVARDLECVVLR